jgi:hypothetical protein
MELTQVEIDALLQFKTNRLFAKWIWRLRLRDWNIRWRVVRKGELPVDRSGACDSSAMKRTANIRILHPEDADSAWLDPYDLELTIVHELIHLHLASWALLFDEGDQANLFLEQAVHALSSTFVAADREDRPWSNFPEDGSVQDTRSVV